MRHALQERPRFASIRRIEPYAPMPRSGRAVLRFREHGVGGAPRHIRRTARVGIEVPERVDDILRREPSFFARVGVVEIPLVAHLRVPFFFFFVRNGVTFHANHTAFSSRRLIACPPS